MRRTAALIPHSRQHHQLLLMGRAARPDIPPLKGMPGDFAGKLQYLQHTVPLALFPHWEMERNWHSWLGSRYSFLSAELSQMEELRQTLARQFETIEHEAALKHFCQMLDSLIRFEERVFFEKLQNTLSGAQLMGSIEDSQSHFLPIACILKPSR